MKTINNLKADQIRKSILQLAIQGKLVKQDPNDEPASELVKKIYEEKKKLIAEGKLKKDKNESYIFKGEDNCYYEKVGKNEPVKLEDLPFDIPDNWMWIRLPELVEFRIGKTPERHSPKYWSESVYPWISIADMKEKQVLFSTKEKISSDALSKYFGNTLSPKGTLIMSFKLTIGKVSILGVDAVHNEAIISIFPYLSENNLIRDWLFYTLGLLVDYVDQTDAIKGKTLNKDKMSSMLIPLPPLNEQKRIISRLLKSEALLNEYGVLETKLSVLENSFSDNLKKSILQYAIEGKLVKQDPNDEPASVLLERIKAEKEQLIKEGKIKRDKNESTIYQGDDKNYYEKKQDHTNKFEQTFEWPNSWTIIKISDVFTVARGGSPRPIQEYLTNEGNGINWIKIGDTDINCKYIRSCKEKIKPSGLSKTRFVKKGDFLLTNSMSFGHPYILKIDGCIHDGWLVLSDRFDLYDKDFLYHLLSSPFVYKCFCSLVGGSVVKNLNSDKVSNTIIPLPPMTEQKRISNKIERIFEII